MKKPKLKNFIFRKGIKSYFFHLNKYYRKKEKMTLKEAQDYLDVDHNTQQSLEGREYIKVLKVKDDGTIIYQIKK